MADRMVFPPHFGVKNLPGVYLKFPYRRKEDLHLGISFVIFDVQNGARIRANPPRNLALSEIYFSPRFFRGIAQGPGKGLHRNLPHFYSNLPSLSDKCMKFHLLYGLPYTIYTLSKA
ncbi:MAG: hypothetical protein ACLUO8_09430 [Christensenellales bacterium]